MAVIREDKYRISLEDGLTTEWKRLETEIKAGSQANANAINQMSASSQKYGQETSRLTSFIKEQRTEQRQQNFLFSQSRDVIGAASIALTAFGVTAEGEMKKVSQAVNQGYVAFQGVDFLLSSLGVAGPWGMAIAGAAGLAAVFVELSNNEKDTAEQIKRANEELEKQNKALDNLIGKADAWKSKLSGGTSAEQRTATQAEVQLLQARSNIIDEVVKRQQAGEKEINIVIDDRNKSLAEISAMQQEAIAASSRTATQNKLIADGLHEQLRSMQAMTLETEANNSFLAKTFTLTQSTKITWDEMSESIRKAMDEQEKLRQSRTLKPLGQRDVVKIPKMDFSNDPDVKFMERMNSELDRLGFTAENTASLISNTMKSASQSMVDAMFEGTASVEEMFKNLMKRITEMIIEETLIKAFLNLISGGQGGGFIDILPGKTKDWQNYAGTAPSFPTAGRTTPAFQRVNTSTTTVRHVVALDASVSEHLSVDERKRLAKAFTKAVERGKYA